MNFLLANGTGKGLIKIHVLKSKWLLLMMTLVHLPCLDFHLRARKQPPLSKDLTSKTKKKEKKRKNR
jgi:hypothetical protein